MPATERFVAKWQHSGGSELGSSQSFINELCEILGVESPNSPRPALADNTYLFEKTVKSSDNTSLRIDCYKRGFFIWESKQGADKLDARGKGEYKLGTFARNTKTWDTGMFKAYEQALNYARLLPQEEGAPPFILVSDIGYAIDVYADFKGHGVYTPYPNARENRIYLHDIRRPEVQEMLRAVWTDPMSLDLSRENEKVTNDIGAKLGALAKSLEDSGHTAEDVAGFLMKCIFSMYSEDSGLLPGGAFGEMLDRATPDTFAKLANEAWESMKKGGESSALKGNVLEFGGFLFKDTEALPLNREQLDLLREAAAANWANVETSIFGSILEQALTKDERHKLGAHYTPTSYVERLIVPTFLNDLRSDWKDTLSRANALVKSSDLNGAAKEVDQFLKRLSEVVILDPSSGSGNFLTVSMQAMKELESEAVDALRQLGRSDYDIARSGLSIGPGQFKGIEITPKGSEISELVLWIAYLQSHYKAYGQVNPPEPIFNDKRSVECRDAVLAFDAVGKARQADDWPQADYIVGNPPFMGNHKMREAFGDKYTESLREAYPKIPKSADYVMYWWARSAELVKSGKIKRFGLITTNSIRQVNNRRLLDYYMDGKPPLSIVFAVPDHPWVVDGASVRIAMTAAEAGSKDGILQRINEDGVFDVKTGRINSNLTVGADMTNSVQLKANDKICHRGVLLSGSGFIVSSTEAQKLGLGKIEGLEKHIRHYRNGNDISQKSRNVMVIDLYGLEIEEVEKEFPDVYDWVLKKVKPQREKSRESRQKENWWVFSRPRPQMREALHGLSRYIATPETSANRFFTFLDASILPDNALVVFAADDAYVLGILSSSVHTIWAAGNGGSLGTGTRYLVERCFDTFPFPEADEAQKDTIRGIAEEIVSRREIAQSESGIKLTGIYAILEKLRSGMELDAKEKALCERGNLIELLELHKRLDRAVYACYGWPDDLSEEETVARLFELNQKRAEEEKNGHIRWLSPKPLDNCVQFSFLEFSNEAESLVLPISHEMKKAQ